jgi:outer membrane protein assembly factor BamB
MDTTIRSFTIAAAVLAAAPALPAQTMFRGDPAHHGVYRGGGPTLVGMAWRAPTGGDVVSSPAIADGVVYVGSDEGSLYAFDLATGARRWRVNLESPVSASPAVGGGLVYVAARDGRVWAFDAGTGTRRWRLSTGALRAFPWGHESGDYYVSSPTYVAGVVVFGAGDGQVYAVESSSGRIRWRAATGGRIRGTPAVSEGRVFVGAFDGRVYCFDLSTGALRWRFETSGVGLHSENFGYDRRSVQSSPAVADGVVYVGARDGFLYAIDAQTGRQRWTFDHKISWVNSSPAAFGGLVFVGSSDAHFVQAVDSAGTERWRTTTPGLVWSSPAVAGTVVYFGDGSGGLHAVDRTSGAERWVFRTSASIYSSPAVSGEYIVVGSSDGGVYAVRADDGPPIARAVFYDSAVAGQGHLPRAEATAGYLAARGYQVLDTATLGSFLESRIADRGPSVVVFAIDYLPASIATEPPERSEFRRYLESGGKVVWSGPPPRLFPATMPPGRIELDWGVSGALTGVPQDSALFDRRGVAASAIGERWGLPPRWRDAWSVAPAGVSVVLGLDEWGLASAWLKSFGGEPGTGLVRVPPDDPFVVYLAAEVRARGSSEREHPAR